MQAIFYAKSRPGASARECRLRPRHQRQPLARPGLRPGRPHAADGWHQPDGHCLIDSPLDYLLRVPEGAPAPVYSEPLAGTRHIADIGFLFGEDLYNLDGYMGFVMAPPAPPAMTERMWRDDSIQDNFPHCVKLVRDIVLHVDYRLPQLAYGYRPACRRAVSRFRLASE